MQKALLEFPLSIRFITSRHSSIFTLGDLIRTSVPCWTVHFGLIAC